MFQSNYQKNLEAIKIKPNELKNLQNSSDREQKQYDPFVFEEDIAEKSNKVADDWKQEQAKRQNQVATLLEVREEDEEAEISPIQKPIIQHTTQTLEYKLIGISKRQQLNCLRSLITTEFIQNCQQQKTPITWAGIVAQVNKKNVGLVLANVSAKKGVVEVIYGFVLPRYPQEKIKKNLVLCLEKSLPKFKCDRLEYKI